MTSLQHTPITPLVLAAALWLLLPAAQAAETPAPHKSAVHASSPPAGMPQFGVGQYGRSLTLGLPTDGDSIAPAPNTPYRLFVTGKDDSIQNTPSQDGILHGVTDAQGRTAWVWTQLPHAAKDFTLIRRIGDGAWGHFFQLNSSDDNGHLPAWPYIMTMRQRWGEQWVDLGYTTRQGATAYFSHDVPAAALSLSIDAPVINNRACFAELDAINRKFTQNDPAGAEQLINAMQCADTPRQQLDLAHLLLLAGQQDQARHWLLRARQWRFPESLTRTDTDLLQDRMNLERLLEIPHLALADSQALQQRQARRGRAPAGTEPDLANEIAYYLADFPSFLPDAEAQARLSIRNTGPNPYNQGTLGWILALQGDTQEGLRLMHESYRDIPRNEEIVADYGLTLWRNGQPEQAVRLWDEAQAQCVWGRRLHDAMRQAAYPHPYFQAASSDAVNAYRQRCDKPWTKRKTITDRAPGDRIKTG